MHVTDWGCKVWRTLADLPAAFLLKPRTSRECAWCYFPRHLLIHLLIHHSRGNKSWAITDLRVPEHSFLSAVRVRPRWSMAHSDTRMEEWFWHFVKSAGLGLEFCKKVIDWQTEARKIRETTSRVTRKLLPGFPGNYFPETTLPVPGKWLPSDIFT